MELNLAERRVLVAGGSEGKLLISHIVLTVICSVATWKVRLITNSRAA
jgi:UDP-N-acetylglucosamine:LPS N-acetylglucosamine transferase